MERKLRGHRVGGSTLNEPHRLTAHYVSDYEDVASIRFPTRHRIFPRDADGQSLAEPLVVSIDLSEIAFT